MHNQMQRFGKWWHSFDITNNSCFSLLNDLCFTVAMNANIILIFSKTFRNPVVRFQLSWEKSYSKVYNSNGKWVATPTLSFKMPIDLVCSHFLSFCHSTNEILLKLIMKMFRFLSHWWNMQLNSRFLQSGEKEMEAHRRCSMIAAQ